MNSYLSLFASIYTETCARLPETWTFDIDRGFIVGTSASKDHEAF